MRLLKEPLFHFFLLGAFLFLSHHVLVGDPRTITITPGLKAELSRRLQDRNGRAPNAEEVADALAQWKREEALYREALREHLDRDDPSIRTVLIDKLHTLTAFKLPKLEASDAQLNEFLVSHQKLYRSPIRYDFEFVAFPKGAPAAAQDLEKLDRALQTGADPTKLGRPLVGGKLSADEMSTRIAPELAARIPSLPIGQWQHIETEKDLLLARVKGIEGGLPPLAEVRDAVLSDWLSVTRDQAVEKLLDRTVLRYRFEERK